MVKTRLGPTILEANKIKRKAFVQKLLVNGDNFDNILWTDKSSVQLIRHCTTMWVEVGKEWVIKPKPKHPGKVHVWAGILMHGACVMKTIGSCKIMIQNIRPGLQRTSTTLSGSSGGKHLQAVRTSTP